MLVWSILIAFESIYLTIEHMHKNKKGGDIVNDIKYSITYKILVFLTEI